MAWKRSMGETMAYSRIPSEDMVILRGLGRLIVEISVSPVNEEHAELQRRVNNLEMVKPPVYVYEIPWHEMNVGDELTLRTRHPLCRRYEERLRRLIYKWRHGLGVLVDDPRFSSSLSLEPVVEQPLQDYVIDTGFGVSVKEDIARVDEKNPVVSHRYHVQIKCEEDVEKIRVPEVFFDEEKAEEEFEMLREVFDGVLPVEKRGVSAFWFAPWDEIVMLTGVKEVLVDMYRRPRYVHRLVEKMVDAWLQRLDKYEELGLLRDSPMRLWGVGAAQVFAAVSPAMHEEFALKHEKRWYERWGFNYYGCCEPLHHKVEVLRRNIPRLRRISMSPFIDFDKAVGNVGDEFIFAWKPNPAVLAESSWNPEAVRRDMEDKLGKARRFNCVMEIHMKDISTVRYQPQRLWEWARIAASAAEKYV
jgi:hypothetical protein